MRENCNGTDFCPLLMKGAAEKGTRMFFLGGREGIAEKAAERTRERMSGIRIVGAHSGYFATADEVVKKINASKAEILFVGMGAPLQEKWIFRNRERLDPKMCLGVGALFDWLSDHKKRAPLFMRRLCLEWLWRLAIDGRRLFKRYVFHGPAFLVYLIWRRVMRRASR